MHQPLRRIALTLLACALIAPKGAFAQPRSDEIETTEVPSVAELDDEDALLINLSILSEVLARVEQNHYDDPGVSQLIDGAIRGLLLKLDPYSQYYDATAYEALQTDTSGKFGGLGMYIGLKQNRLTVISPIEDTPAFEAGMMAGDRIVEIDGESTAGMSADDAARLMRGEPGSDVTLTVVREGLDEPLVVAITRDIITVVSVKYRNLKSNAGYIRVTQFMEPTAQAVEDAIRALEADGAEALILDLRSNPGGLLSSAVKIASIFLNESDLIVYTKGRGQREDFFVTEKSFHTDLPLIALVNRGSASASEIVAGAIQAHHRGILMGATTFGKASVQKIYPIREGGRSSAVKLTIAHYYTPNDMDIHEVGIEPDVALDGFSALESRMWRKARSSEALQKFIEEKGDGLLDDLTPENLRDSSAELARDYRTFINGLDEEGVVLSDALIKYALAVETVTDADDYEYDPQIRAAIQYLRALNAFRGLRSNGTPVE